MHVLASALGEGRMACFVLAGLRHEEGGRGLTWLLAVGHGIYAYTLDKKKKKKRGMHETILEKGGGVLVLVHVLHT
jgi:hypothetical protein